MVFWVILVHPSVVSVLLSASVERYVVSRMQDFFGAFGLLFKKVKKMDFPLHFQILRGRVQGNFFMLAKGLVFTY